MAGTGNHSMTSPISSAAAAWLARKLPAQAGKRDDQRLCRSALTLWHGGGQKPRVGNRASTLPADNPSGDGDTAVPLRPVIAGRLVKIERNP